VKEFTIVIRYAEQASSFDKWKKIYYRCVLKRYEGASEYHESDFCISGKRPTYSRVRHFSVNQIKNWLKRAIKKAENKWREIESEDDLFGGTRRIIFHVNAWDDTFHDSSGN